MVRGIGCNNCKVALILQEDNYENSIQESIFRIMHQNHMVVVGELDEFSSFIKIGSEVMV